MEYAQQYGCLCVVLNGSEDADDVIERCSLGAIYQHSEEDEPEFCVRFPGRPQELYTESALRRSLKSNAL